MPHLSSISRDSIEAMSIRYNTRVYELSQQGVPITVMSLGEAFFDMPLLGFDDLPFPDLYHYSHSRGIPSLRDVLARDLGARHGIPIDTQTEILITAGSKAAIHMALMSILDPGDEVIIHEPAWVSYPEQVKLCYGVPVHVPHHETIRDFERYVTPRTKAIIINNPHNPRGYVHSVDELRFILSLAERRGLWVLADEAYSDFVADDSFVSIGALDKEKRVSIVCNSISKNLGMSGWRIGYVIADARVIHSILKINQHLITCPSTILEFYLARHFDELRAIAAPQIQATLDRRRQLACHMDRIGLTYLEGSATFYFFVSIAPSALSSEEFCTRLLDEEHISTVPGLGYGYSCDQFIRVAIGSTTLDQARYGLDRIRSLIDATA
jgi:aminotransferase